MNATITPLSYTQGWRQSNPSVEPRKDDSTVASWAIVVGIFALAALIHFYQG